MSDKLIIEDAAYQFTKLLGTECVVQSCPDIDGNNVYYLDIEKIQSSIWYAAGLWIVGGQSGDPYYGRSCIADLARQMLSDEAYPQLHEKAN